MSVLVRMEMPQGCWCCPFGHYDWIWGDDGREKMVCFCCLDGESEEDGHYLLETELKRPSWCPIICSLPDGLGRLVDADALKEWFIEQIDYYKRFDGPNCSMMVSAYEAVCQVINEMTTTIVPAERSET